MTDCFCIDNLEELPEVGIVYGYGSCSTVALEAFVNAGYKGIVFPLATTSDISAIIPPASCTDETSRQAGDSAGRISPKGACKRPDGAPA